MLSIVRVSNCKNRRLSYLNNMRWIFRKIKSFVIWTYKQLKDWKNLLIFAVVFVIVSCEVWVPYLIGVITGDAYWYGIGSLCWAFWLAPGTPFITLCILITIAIRKIIDKIFKRRNNDT